MLIDSYQPEGSNANIESFFFYNTDKDDSKELVVLCSWKQNFKDVTDGKLYQVYIYDNYKNETDELFFLDKISNHFEMEFEGIREGEKISAKFKDAKSIKKEIK